MKIVTSEGCTAFWTTVNGKMLGDMSDSEIKETFDKIIKTFFSEPNEMEKFIRTLPLDYGHIIYESDPCEQCGDTVYQWEVEL